jgi:hypothetical protein
VDDDATRILILEGLALDGRITIAGCPDFMWLKGLRDCVLMRPTKEGTRNGRVSFRALAVGEFCVEIYLVRPGGSIELLHENDFCFK